MVNKPHRKKKEEEEEEKDHFNYTSKEDFHGLGANLHLLNLSGSFV